MGATRTIKDKIGTMLGTVTKLQAVYKYFEPLPQQFPCAMIEAYKGDKDEIYTNTQNMMVRRFVIHVQITGKNTQQNSDLRADILDDVIDVINSATYGYSMDNTADIMVVDSVDTWDDNNSESPKIGIDFIISCKTVDNLS